MKKFLKLNCNFLSFNKNFFFKKMIKKEKRNQFKNFKIIIKNFNKFSFNKIKNQKYQAY